MTKLRPKAYLVTIYDYTISYEICRLKSEVKDILYQYEDSRVNTTVTPLFSEKQVMKNKNWL